MVDLGLLKSCCDVSYDDCCENDSGFTGLGVVPNMELFITEDGGRPAGVNEPPDEGGGPAGVVEGFEAPKSK